MSEEQLSVPDKSWDRVIRIVQTGLLTQQDVSGELRAIRLVPDRDVEAADEVWHRVVQALQESMLTLTNVIDALRMIRLVERDGKLFLSDEYKQLVTKMHSAMLDEVEMLRKRGAGEGN